MPLRECIKPFPAPTACGYNRPMGTKRKARKPAIPRVSKTARETSEIVALLLRIPIMTDS